MANNPITATIINETDCHLWWTNDQGMVFDLPAGQTIQEAIETNTQWSVTDGTTTFAVMAQNDWSISQVLGCGMIDVFVLPAPVTPVRIYKGVQRRA